MGIIIPLTVQKSFRRNIDCPYKSIICSDPNWMQKKKSNLKKLYGNSKYNCQSTKKAAYQTASYNWKWV